VSGLHLAFDLSYADLFDPAALARLDQRFRDALRASDASLSSRFEAYRAAPASLTGAAEAQLIVEVGRHLDGFVATLFGVQAEAGAYRAAADGERAVMRLKKDLWRKRAAKLVLAEADHAAARGAMHGVLAACGVPEADTEKEVSVARAVVRLLDLEDHCAKALAKGGVVTTDDDLSALAALREAIAKEPRAAAVAPASTGDALKDGKALCTAALDAIARGIAVLAAEAGEHARAWATEGPLRPEDGLAHPRGWASFRTPRTVDHEKLVHLRRPSEKLQEIAVGPDDTRRARDGFALTDARHPRLEVANEVDYCILCHEREKDSCRRGVKESKKGETDVALKKNPLGVTLAGCPLEERIGEMHALRAEGLSLGALAVVTIDNPMCAGTGHRICNDCMKACIYQKQDPVNIPQAETGALTDVLSLPWGVEIYGLFQRWNPLRAQRPYQLPYNGKNVLVVGMGPAGYTLCQHLLNEGFGVVGVDGLKIEPLPPALVGDLLHGVAPQPIETHASMVHDLGERRTLGFGGVSEYGITIRWDKNFNDLLALGLLRRSTFRLYGGVRFGGAIGVEEAWELGFDHVAIAAGAGKPTLVDVPNGLARGVRQASDFLMALQLTGAFKRRALANLQVRLPAVVIGGGLTAIDTGTELAAYYVVQVERTLERIETLISERGEAATWGLFDAEERAIIEEEVEHGRAVRAERIAARKAGRAPRFAPLVEKWGGVTIAYRRTMKESPAYRLNHEEIIKALEEGVRFGEELSPREVLVDEHGAARAMVFGRKDGSSVELPARTICVAAGTTPNVTYERERSGSFEMDPKTRAFAPHVVSRDASGKLVVTKDPDGFFTSYNDGAHAVSFYGDSLPRYAGSVVKAMASAKDGYPHVVALFADALAGLRAEEQPARDAAWKAMAAQLDDELVATIHEVKRLTPTIVEVIVRAKRAARAFEPGQFYRLQNFEADAPVVDGTPLLSEGIALTGAWVDREKGLLSTIVLEMGGSTRLCATWKPGQRIVAMGPTGAPTEIPENENVVLCGGGLGNAVLFSIGKALRARGCRVLYFAGYRSPDDVYHREEIEAASDAVVWACDRAPAPAAQRPTDRSFVGNMVQAMVAYAKGELAMEGPFALSAMQRLIVIGSDRLMAAVQAARRPTGALGPYVSRDAHGVASINSPMQCMMKEICAQCLQRQVDPVTGKVTIVFTCSNQDQDLEKVDFPFLASRLRSSSAQEKLTSAWLDRLLGRGELPRV
jgi:NADPH-dependent glutamate synthase beta subunit-like oxidoreductase/NAD(P)H-flavin reductase